MTRPQQSDLQTLVAAQGQTREQVTAQMTAIAAASVAGFTGWYSTEQITDWAAQLVKVLNPLLRLLARNTDAYLARAVTQVSGSPFRPVGAIDITSLRNGITQEGAYARAADVYRWQQSQYDRIAELAQIDVPAAEKMLGLVEPAQAAANRLQAVVETDTQLAVQQQAQATLTAAEDRDQVTGWRRVIHPELSIHGTCGLCIAASDRVYKVSHLMPIHQRCNCIVTPVYGDNDPGSVLNDGDLRRIYKDAGSTGRTDLKRTRYVVNEHGELGPVLSGKKIRTDTGRTARTQPAPMTPEQRRVKVEQIYQKLSDEIPKIRDLEYAAPAQWGPYLRSMENRITELEKELANT